MRCAGMSRRTSRWEDSFSGSGFGYYVVLDTFARQDVLKSVLNYDNSAFLTALKARGFYIPDCAFSNYDGTDLMLSSVLNYDILQSLEVSGRKVVQDLAKKIMALTGNQGVDVAPGQFRCLPGHRCGRRPYRQRMRARQTGPVKSGQTLGAEYHPDHPAGRYRYYSHAF